ncbi:MAG: type II secretion system GspH family protein [Acidobacteriota bacterium]|nr:type II secretion system GspH family protein [Acidobacteriota bacterium]
MRSQRGFTLIELLIVVALIALLVGVAVPTYRNAQRKARESVLQENLFIMRQTIDQYFADKGYYPGGVNVLVDEGYIRKVPIDPIIGEARWDEIPADADTSLDTSQPPGIWDVKSMASGTTLNGVDYGEL